MVHTAKNACFLFSFLVIYEINLMGDELENLRNPDPQGCRLGKEAGGGKSLCCYNSYDVSLLELQIYLSIVACEEEMRAILVAPTSDPILTSALQHGG